MRNVLLCFVVVTTLVNGGQPGAAQPRPPVAAPAANPAPGALVVPLPHPLREESGLIWHVNVDGSVTDGNNELFDSGGQLFVGNSPYAPPIQQANFDAEHNEVLLPAQSAAGLAISRRVSVDPKAGWCRYLEVLENPSANAIRTQVKVRFDLSLGLQQVEQVADDKRGGQLRGVALFDGQHGVALVAAGRGSKVAPQFNSEPGGDALELNYDVEVPARRTIVLAHVCARRPTLAEAATFVRAGKEKDWLRGLTRQVLSWLANFSVGERLAGGAEVLRGDLLDVVELRGGDRYKGTLKEQVYKLRTPYGPVELPADRVVAMVTLGEFRPTQLLVTTDGQIFGGALEAAGGTLKLELSSGQVTNVPLNTVRRFGYRMRPGEGDDAQGGGPGAAPPVGDKPLALLRTGDRVAVHMPPAPIPVATCYGQLRLDPRTISSISLQSEDHEHGVHEVRLTDGSRFAGVVTQERFDVKLAGLGTGTSAAARDASFAATALARLQLARDPDELAKDAATVTLGNGDVLVGTLTGKVVLETAFDAIEVNAEELRSLRPGGGEERATGSGAPSAGPAEVQLTLWDGATLSGRLRGEAIDCRLGCGAAVRVPVALVKEYSQPQPRPPAAAVERIKAVVAELNADDWKTRDRAASQLSALGPGSAGVLKALRDGQPPEVRQRIDQILASFENQGPHPGQPLPVAVPAEAGPGVPVAPNPPAAVDADAPAPAPQERG